MGEVNIIDLFAGCGGLSLGFEMAGFKIPLAIEIDDWASETYSQNHPDTYVMTEDITQVTDLDSLLPDKNIKVNGIIGGPPCQGFSLKGKKMGLDDPRNFLFKEYLSLVEKIKPEIFIIENFMVYFNSLQITKF